MLGRSPISLKAILGAVLLSSSTAILCAPAAVAQSNQSKPPALQNPTPKADEPAPSLPDTGESRSEQLNRSNGVIAPPSGVDPGMSVAPADPNAGANMPVIPPPAPPPRSPAPSR
jgi:hypothetical protein